MTHTPDIVRPSKDLIAGILAVGAASASSTLAHMGIRNCHILGPVAQQFGKAIAGPALTLQFMPKREDLYGDGEYSDPENSSTAMCSITCRKAISLSLMRAAI